MTSNPDTAHPEPQAWRGLWRSAQPRAAAHALLAPERLVIYLVVPVGITLLFWFPSGPGAVGRFLSGYARAALITACISGSIELLYQGLWPRLIRREPSWLVRIAGHGATVVAGSLLGSAGAARLVELGWGTPYEDMRADLWHSGLVFGCAIVAVLVVHEELSERVARSQRAEQQARTGAVRAQLAALQARTDPHFLFNSLNSVASLIPDDPDAAERMLERLAAVFRYALESGRRGSVRLDEELAAVRAYLAVEQVRFGERLQVELHAPAELGELRVPPLVIQPLVENAIRHGAAHRRSATHVRVGVAERGDALVISVADAPVSGSEPGERTVLPPGTGTSLADLEARLRLAYGKDARLVHGPSAGGGYGAEIVLSRARCAAWAELTERHDGDSSP